LRVSDVSNPAVFNPHAVESVVNRLIAHYRRVGKNEELQRLHLAVAQAFEHFGTLANPMLASTVFQTSMDAYRQAGMRADEKRILRLIEKSNVESIAQMRFHEVKQEIPHEDVEKFVSQIIGPTKEDTFDRIAKEFLTVRSSIEETLKEAAKTAPLSTIFPRTKLSGDRVVAHIGPLDEDLTGRLIEQAYLHIQLSTPWLWWALEAAKQQHALCVDDIVGWANRAGLFGDEALLREGLSAWFVQDHVKAIHVLVPQIEAAFRKLIGHCEQSTTKPHPKMRQARTVVTLGDMLFDQETAASLGKYGSDFVFHLRSLYADPRGYNLRNDLAHGLATARSLNEGITLWVIHSVMLLGAWLKRVDQSSV
jgi:lysyl-tRNA synthetase class 1